MSANPTVSCMGGGCSVSRHIGAETMEWVVAAIAGEGVNIAGDVAFAAPTGAVG